MEPVLQFLSYFTFQIKNKNIINVITVVGLPFALLFFSMACLQYDAGYKLLTQLKKENAVLAIDSFKTVLNDFPGRPLYKYERVDDNNNEQSIRIKILNSKESENVSNLVHFGIFYMVSFIYIAFIAITLYNLYTTSLEEK